MCAIDPKPLSNAISAHAQQPLRTCAQTFHLSFSVDTLLGHPVMSSSTYLILHRLVGRNRRICESTMPFALTPALNHKHFRTSITSTATIKDGTDGNASAVIRYKWCTKEKHALQLEAQWQTPNEAHFVPRKLTSASVCKGR